MAYRCCPLGSSQDVIRTCNKLFGNYKHCIFLTINCMRRKRVKLWDTGCVRHTEQSWVVISVDVLVVCCYFLPNAALWELNLLYQKMLDNLITYSPVSRKVQIFCAEIHFCILEDKGSIVCQCSTSAIEAPMELSDIVLLTHEDPISLDSKTVPNDLLFLLPRIQIQHHIN